MKDREFLAWIHERLQYKHLEDPCVDYMAHLREIIAATPATADTRGLGAGGNSLSEMWWCLRKKERQEGAG